VKDFFEQMICCFPARIKLWTRGKRRVSRANNEALFNYSSPWFDPKIALELGKNESHILKDFVQNAELERKFVIESGIAAGNHWSACRARRVNDGKAVIIKKINRAKLPLEEMYFEACSSNASCLCLRCQPALTTRPPLEQILLQSKDSSLPELLEVIEDQKNIYLITKLHGVNEREWRRFWTWFGPRRFSRVYWYEFFS
jgi:hypothetical protein